MKPKSKLGKQWPALGLRSVSNQQTKKNNVHSSSSQSWLPEDTYLVEGVSAVNEYIRFSPDSIINLIVSRKDESKLVSPAPLSVGVRMSAEEWVQVFPHISVRSPTWCVVKILLSDEQSLQNLLDGEHSPSILVALDHVTDPRNLGAIARSCGFFGVRNMIIPKNRQVELTPASVATAQGAFALVDVFSATNLGRTLRGFKEKGYWVIGADMGGESLGEVAGFYDKSVLVFGAEGAGLSAAVRKICDRIVAVNSSESMLESLNVSVAAGIVLNHFAQKVTR